MFFVIGFVFVFNDKATTEIYTYGHTLSLHDALPICGLVPYRYCRTHPYIFTPAEIVAIIEEAAQLPSIYGMRGLTCSTLFGLIAVTGMRINEALSLDADDVDLDTGIEIGRAHV